MHSIEKHLLITECELERPSGYKVNKTYQAEIIAQV